ncbi:MAG: hypothetical protein E7619_03540 [Ruminococcaceae bacterium]|nr:hypothetical protein [Oscillospiraceae bacterium]
MKRTFLFVLLCFLLAPVLTVAPVRAEEPASLSIISANISGLPAALTKYGRDTEKTQKTLGEMLDLSGYDIVCVQENYNYDKIFGAEMDNYPYRTYTTGGVPVGDGLDIFSVYPIYNVKRVAWKNFNGVFTDGCDALCPKGFISCTVDVNGVLIDLYNVHMDAYRTEADQYAKKAQLEQLAEYIEAHSEERPVLIVGDTNLTFHTDPLAEMHRILIEEGGFTDCWVEVKNNGNYMQDEDGPAIIDRWYARFGGHDWGRWDSVERLFYRDGGGVSFSPTRFEYSIYTDDPSNVKALTDHRMMECVLQMECEGYARPADAMLGLPKKPSVIAKCFSGAAMLLRFCGIVLLGGVTYLWQRYPLITVLLAASLATLIFIAVKKRKRKKKMLAKRAC